MPVRTAIFDFDGTIADTFSEIVGVLGQLAPEYGYRNADAAEVQELRGMSARAAAARLDLDWYKVPGLVARVRKEMLANMVRVRPYAGVPDALARLRAGGIALGLLTSNNRENVEAFLERNPLEFDFVTTGSGIWSKHRRLAAVARSRKLIASETAYVGDETRDVEAAQTAGMQAIAVGWGFTKVELLRTASPDRLVASPDELPAALGVST